MFGNINIFINLHSKIIAPNMQCNGPDCALLSLVSTIHVFLYVHFVCALFCKIAFGEIVNVNNFWAHYNLLIWQCIVQTRPNRKRIG